MIFRALVGSQLLSEKLRTLMTLFAVAVGVALVLAIDLANATALASFARSVNIVSRHVNLQVLAIGSGFSESVYPRVAALESIRSVRPIIETAFTIDKRPGKPLSGEVLHIIGTDLLRPLPTLEDSPDSNATALLSPAALLDQRGAIISDRIAQRYHLKPGSLLRGIAGDRYVDLTVAGILPQDTVGIDSSVVFVDLSTAQEQFHHLGTLDRLDLEVDPQKLAQVQSTLHHLLPTDTRVITPATRNGEIERMLKSFALNLQALAAIALVVGLFLVFNTVAISVVQRRREIGVLRGLGASRGAILLSFLQEGLFFGVGGSLLGIILGNYLAAAAVGAVSQTVASLYVSTHADGVVISAGPYSKALLLGIASAVLAALLPAREAAALPPAAMMRSEGVEPAGVWGTRACLLLALGCAGAALVLAHLPAINEMPLCGYLAAILAIAAGAALALPGVSLLSSLLRVAARTRGVTFRLAATNVLRSKGRVSISVATLMIAIGMMVSIAVLIGSFRTTVVAWANESLKADLFVRPLGYVDTSSNLSLSPALEQRLRHLKGVTAVDTFRTISLPYQGRLTSLGAVEMQSLIERPRLRLLGTASLRPYADKLEHGPWVLVSEPFVNRYHLTTGDNLRIDTPSGPTLLHIAAVYNDYSSDNGFILIDRSQFKRLFHADGIDSLAVYAQPKTDIAALRTAILQSALPSHVDVESTRELRKYVIAIFDQTFAITYALYVIAIIVAGLGIVTTLFALVIERKRDIGILRYLGLSVAGVRRMILAEAAGIGLMGAGLGIVLGIALGLDLIYVINRQSFGWLIELTMPWAFLGETMVLAIVAALLAGIIPAGMAARIRTTEVLREE